MADLISPDQVDQIRQAMTDIADTFAFPITLIRTTYSAGAFAGDPEVEEIELTAIREFKSNSMDDQFRNNLGPDGYHEFDLYIGWESCEDADLITDDNKVDLDHNDVVSMEGEIYEIVAFSGVADMTKKPSFLQMTVKRRFNAINGATEV